MEYILRGLFSYQGFGSPPPLAIENIQRMYDFSTIAIFDSLQKRLLHYLEQLDPSLFQSIILGILTIFIPFAIVVIADIFRKKSGFEKLVVKNEVLAIKRVFWLAVISMFIFAFLSETEAPITEKTASIALALLFILLFLKALNDILRFSENKSEFEMKFLRKLKFSKIFKLRNEKKSEQMELAWKSFWSQESTSDLLSGLTVFIAFIDDAIKHGKLKLAGDLSQVCMGNINKQNYRLAPEILLKIFELDKKLWDVDNIFRKHIKKHSNNKEKIQNFFLWKRLPVLRNRRLKIHEMRHPLNNYPGNWGSSISNFFAKQIGMLIKENHGLHHFLVMFKIHIEDHIKKGNNEYVNRLFRIFCPTLFSRMGNAPPDYLFWDYDFPPEWKVSMQNENNMIPQLVFHEFIKWFQTKIFDVTYNSSNKNDLGTVIGGIFPQVHPFLFERFLMLHFLPDIKDALKENPNFSIIETYIVGELLPYKNEEDWIKASDQKQKKRETLQKRETAQIILRFFYRWIWGKSHHYNQISEEERENWRIYTKEKRQLRSYEIWKETLEKMKAETESDDEIKEMCRKNETQEWRRQNTVELLDLLIKEVEKKYSEYPPAP